MRPDPYKQRRSRQYQARQRAAGKAQGAGGAESDGAPRETVRSHALPSNAARYEEEEVAPDALFDYGTADELAAALDALRGQSIGDGSGAHGPHQPSTHGGHLLTDADVLAIDAALAGQEACELELKGLPDFGFANCPPSARESPSRKEDMVVSCVRNLRLNEQSASAVQPQALPQTTAPSKDEEWLDSVI